uniref:dihydrofolate reductase n=1 Tax=viral metagenome TaxID=1070528 RepID=A0A6C0I9G3_9ZZZZ
MLHTKIRLEIEAIVAVDAENGIAKDGKIPWKSKTDMKFFREQTTGSIIIMGSTTLLSLPNALPLPNRLNIVVTRTPSKYTCYPKYSQLDNILFWAEDTLFKFLNNQDLNKNLIKTELENYNKIFVIGGQQIYELLLPFCSSIWVSKIKQDYNCDLQMTCLSNIKLDGKIYYEDEELQITQLALRY